MDRQELFELIKTRRSFLCIGLDPDMKKIPSHLSKYDDPVFEFNKRIVDHTIAFTVAYKPNLAFYECLGTNGWKSLEKTIHYIRQKQQKIFLIADAKRGDIGNTSTMYARAFFKQMNFDAITVAPYMGEDSVKPFLEMNGWVILLALTSNKGSSDFQVKEIIGHNQPAHPLYEEVIIKSKQWGTPNNMMYVVGATKPRYFEHIRKLIPGHFLLVPGVGAQGGRLEEVAKHGLNKRCGLLVNSSRGIIYAGKGEDFMLAAQQQAKKLQMEMEKILVINKLI